MIVEVWDDNKPAPDTLIGKASIHLGDLHDKGKIVHKDLPGITHSALTTKLERLSLKKAAAVWR